MNKTGTKTGTMSKTRTIIAALAVFAVLLLAGACSSGGSKNATTSGGSKTSQSESGGTKSSGSDKSDSAFCRKVKSYDSQSDSNLSAKDTIKALKDLKSSAPSEIKDDLQTVINLTEKLTNIDTSNPAAVASAYKNVDTSNIDSASKNLDAYVKQHCGISLTEGVS